MLNASLNQYTDGLTGWISAHPSLPRSRTKVLITNDSTANHRIPRKMQFLRDFINAANYLYMSYVRVVIRYKCSG